ncbi:MAG: pyruvate synthase [Candidatus Lokiarchaeota archaeon]|nr:pyruvate synthase [Candidatus Lokiarchaeota archaeon]
MITEIIVLGRGGQGAVTGAQIIAEAAYLSKEYSDVASSPTFGTERRGSPVYAYTRIADEKIWTRQQIEAPDIVVVLDETILTKPFIQSIKPNGYFILNTDKCAAEVIELYGLSEDKNIAVSNVTHICIENNFIVDGQPMVNTPILGVFAKVLDTISFDNIKKAIISRIGDKKADKNIEIAKIAAGMVDIRRGGIQ